MKNNRLKKISIEGGSAPLNRFNPSGDCHITMGFGEISPTYCMEIEPNSSMSVNRETLALLAPMVAPTMGRMNLETFGVFVPTKSVLPYFDAYLAKKHFNYAGTTFTPSHRLLVPRHILSMFALIGARATCWSLVGNDSSLHSYIAMNSTECGQFVTGMRTDCNSSNFLARGGSVFSGYSMGNCFRLPSKALDYRCGIGTSGYSDMVIPLYNASNGNNNNDLCYDESSTTANNVLPDSADVIIFFNSPSSVAVNSSNNFAMTFRLSGFGKRIKKIFDCVGIPIDFNDPTEIDITPLLAYFMAYYEFWAPKLWQNYEDTPCCKLVNQFMFNGTPIWSSVRSMPTLLGAFQDFFYSLGNCWFTDEKDFISAHQANVESSSSSVNLTSFIDVFGSGTLPGSVSQAMSTIMSMSESDYQKNGHAAINRLIHSQVDSNLLKRLYRWTNINSVLGQRTGDVLRAMGFGDWLDLHKVHFVGHSSVSLRISNVVSQSDTYKEATATEDASGASLGEYGGRGLGYDENSSFSFRTNEKGYFILMSVVVPKSGYAQSLNPALIKTDADSEYQAMFDALGMELTPKSVVAGDSPVSFLFSGAYASAQSFGYIPRHTRYKVGRNINAGQFALRSMRKSFSPYTLDKLIFPDEQIHIEDTDIGGGKIQRKYHKSALTYGTLPTAGTVWDYVSRWTWLNNLSRIFLYRGERDVRVPDPIDELIGVSPDVGDLCYDTYDNFIVHFVDQAKYYAHMLALEDSFETLDDGNDGKPNSEFVKA